MGDGVGDCGGCFSEMVPLYVSAWGVGDARSGPTVGKLCPNCHRVYLEDLINGVGPIRLSVNRDHIMEDE